MAQLKAARKASTSSRSMSVNRIPSMGSHTLPRHEVRQRVRLIPSNAADFTPLKSAQLVAAPAQCNGDTASLSTQDSKSMGAPAASSEKEFSQSSYTRCVFLIRALFKLLRCLYNTTYTFLQFLQHIDITKSVC